MALGNNDFNSTAPPVTKGAAIDVPSMEPYSGLFPNMSVTWRDRVLTIFTPGAAKVTNRGL